MRDSSEPTSKLQQFLDAASRDQWIAIENLAVVSLLRTSYDICKTTWQGNGFLSVVSDTAGVGLIMAMARLLDEDNRGESVTIIGVCNYAQQNPAECKWLFGPSGQRRYPDGEAELLRRCDKWREWVRSLKVSKDVKTLRDKAFAHLDKKHVLGEIEIPLPMMAEMRNAVREIGHFVNDFNHIVADSETGDWYLYEQIFRDGAQFLAVQEAKWEGIVEKPAREAWREFVRPIEKAIYDKHLEQYGESHELQQ